MSNTGIEHQFKIKYKLPIIIVPAALILATGIGGSSYFAASREAHVQINNKLSTIVEARKAGLRGIAGDGQSHDDMSCKQATDSGVCLKAV